MKRRLSLFVAAMLIALSGVANAGQIWTDGNGDGLPDGGPFMVAPNTTVTVGVWVDAQSFAWTNYLAYVEWNSGCLTYQSASYVITGGSNFPIDDFSNPNAVGFGGNGFNEGGVDHIGNINLRIDLPVSCCVTPIIDAYNPFYTFSQLGAGSAYQLFTTNPGTCYGEETPPTEACCFVACDGGGCLDLPPADCVAAGGIPWGPGTACNQVTCPPTPPCTGACCFPDGSCLVLGPAECSALGGSYAGDDVPCSAALCEIPDPLEACCFSNGGCADLLPADCATQGGNSQGAGSSCSTVACPQPPTGACCTPEPGCLDNVTLDECDAAEGIWFPNTTCADACAPDAVESKTWGGIKGLFR